MKKLLLLSALSIINFSLLIAKDPTRLSNGKPSSAYWQQRTDYTITATLDPKANLLTGKGTITYFNNSPDTLTTLVWHLYQNIFRKDSSPRKNDEVSTRAVAETNGMTIEKISIGGSNIEPTIDETIMETHLLKPLLPKSFVEISIVWNYDIPKNPELRTGSDGDDFGICQWYPQLAVYDDVRGWDRTQYLGIAEFYTEFGNWNVEITVPKNFIIASTGTLLNPQEILSDVQLQRFNSLSKDSTTRIILPNETSQKADSTEIRTWKFSAENVRDFAFAASPDFVWDGTLTNDGVRIYAFYKAEDYRLSQTFLIDDATNWDNGAMIAKHSIEFFSEHFGKYVYPQATVVSGPVVGMEYPMMVFIEEGDPLSNLMNYTIAHELGHEWYPMMIGSNETNYPFMDEGFTTYITLQFMEKEFGDNAFINPDFAKEYSWMNLPNNNDRPMEQRFYLLEARMGKGASIMAHPYDIPSFEYGVMAYQKPGTVLVMLEDVLGTELFLKAMNEYYSRWLFKHPYPQDFFNTIEDVAGRDLDWFWNQWFDQTWKLDIGVNDVTNEHIEGMWRSTIVLENHQQVKMPATLRLVFADGTKRDIRFSETVWDRGQLAAIVLDSLSSKISNVIVDPEMKLADVNRLNNSWSLPPVVFDYGLNILNTLLYPLDSYRINFSPALSFNLRDGIQVGTDVTGNYMATDHNLSLHTKYGIRSDIPDFELSYSTPIRIFDPQLTTSARVFRLDGFSGWQWIIEKTFDLRKNLARNYRQSFVINTSILSIRVNDVRYLGNPAEWNTTGTLDAGFISLKYFENFSWGKFFVRLDDEFGTPTSSFNYSKLTSELKLDHPFLGMRIHWRLFGGSSTGNVPAQTAHSLTQATPLERFDSWFFRTPVVGQSLRDNIVKSGGGNLFLLRHTIAMNVASLNFSISKGPFVMFADAGTLWDSTTTRFKQFFYDAGIGLQMNIGSITLPSFSTGPIGFGLYFPLFIKDPARPNDKEIEYRWRFVIGVRL